MRVPFAYTPGHPGVDLCACSQLMGMFALCFRWHRFKKRGNLGARQVFNQRTYFFKGRRWGWAWGECRGSGGREAEEGSLGFLWAYVLSLGVGVKAPQMGPSWSLPSKCSVSSLSRSGSTYAGQRNTGSISTVVGTASQSLSSSAVLPHPTLSSE